MTDVKTPKTFSEQNPRQPRKGHIGKAVAVGTGLGLSALAFLYHGSRPNASSSRPTKQNEVAAQQDSNSDNLDNDANQIDVTPETIIDHSAWLHDPKTITKAVNYITQAERDMRENNPGQLKYEQEMIYKILPQQVKEKLEEESGVTGPDAITSDRNQKGHSSIIFLMQELAKPDARPEFAKNMDNLREMSNSGFGELFINANVCILPDPELSAEPATTQPSTQPKGRGR